MSKITILPYEAPYCTICGRTLPKGRTRKCFDCQPRRTYKATAIPPAQPAPYTINDRVAQTVAYGISYGQVIAIVENGWEWPKKKSPSVGRRAVTMKANKKRRCRARITAVAQIPKRFGIWRETGVSMKKLYIKCFRKSSPGVVAWSW